MSEIIGWIGVLVYVVMLYIFRKNITMKLVKDKILWVMLTGLVCKSIFCILSTRQTIKIDAIYLVSGIIIWMYVCLFEVPLMVLDIITCLILSPKGIGKPQGYKTTKYTIITSSIIFVVGVALIIISSLTCNDNECAVPYIICMILISVIINIILLISSLRTRYSIYKINQSGLDVQDYQILNDYKQVVIITLVTFTLSILSVTIKGTDTTKIYRLFGLYCGMQSLIEMFVVCYMFRERKQVIKKIVQMRQIRRTVSIKITKTQSKSII